MKTRRWLSALLCAVLAIGMAGDCSAGEVGEGAPLISSVAGVSGPVQTEETAAANDTAPAFAGAEAFAAAWNQLSDEILEGYRHIRENAVPDPAGEGKKALRLTLTPDTLKLLNFTSNTLAQTDIGWIREIGIDLIPAARNIRRKVTDYRAYYAQGAADAREKEAFTPGGTLTLHVNGQEIASADGWLDLLSGAFFYRFPDLVSGAGQLVLESIYQNQLGNKILMSQGVASRLRDLLPPEELFGKLLEVPAALGEKYVLLEEKAGYVQAGSVSRECMIYTGEIPVQEFIGLLKVVWDMVQQDTGFREALQTWVDDSLWKAYQENLGVSLLMDQMTRNLAGVSSLDMWLDGTYLWMALETGEWEYLREDLDPRNAAAPSGSEITAGSPAAASAGTPAAASEGTSEEVSGETSAEASEPAYTYADLAVEPGKACSPEELKGLQGEAYTLLLEGLWKQEIGLTGDYKPSDALFWSLDRRADDIEAGIEQLLQSVPGDWMVRSEVSVDRDGNPAGLVLSIMADGEELRLMEIRRAVDRDHSALTAGFGEGGRIGFLAEDLCLSGSGDRQLHLSFWDLENSYLEADGTVTIGKNLIRAEGHVLEHGAEVFRLIGTLDGENRLTDIRAYIPQGSLHETAAVFTGRQDPESGKGSYSFRLTEEDTRETAPGTRRKGTLLMPEILIETERGAEGAEGNTGKTVSLKLGSWRGNVIPEGMKLVLYPASGRLQVADESAVYLTMEAVDPEYVSAEEAAKRISEGSESLNNNGNSYMIQLGSNWNPLVVINRLLQAGMPEDQLKDFRLNGESIPDILNSLGLHF